MSVKVIQLTLDIALTDTENVEQRINIIYTQIVNQVKRPTAKVIDDGHAPYYQDITDQYNDDMLKHMEEK